MPIQPTAWRAGRLQSGAMEQYPYGSPKVPTKPINLGGSRASTWFTMLGGTIGGFTGWLVSAGVLRDSFESLGPVLESLVPSSPSLNQCTMLDRPPLPFSTAIAPHHRAIRPLSRVTPITQPANVGLRLFPMSRAISRCYTRYSVEHAPMGQSGG